MELGFLVIQNVVNFFILLWVVIAIEKLRHSFLIFENDFMLKEFNDVAVLFVE